MARTLGFFLGLVTRLGLGSFSCFAHSTWNGSFIRMFSSSASVSVFISASPTNSKSERFRKLVLFADRVTELFAFLF